MLRSSFLILLAQSTAIPINSPYSSTGTNESLTVEEDASRRYLFGHSDDITAAVDKVADYWVNEDTTSARDERYASLMSMVCEGATGGPDVRKFIKDNIKSNESTMVEGWGTLIATWLVSIWPTFVMAGVMAAFTPRYGNGLCGELGQGINGFFGVIAILATTTGFAMASWASLTRFYTVTKEYWALLTYSDPFCNFFLSTRVLSYKEAFPVLLSAAASLLDLFLFVYATAIILANTMQFLIWACWANFLKALAFIWAQIVCCFSHLGIVCKNILCCPCNTWHCLSVWIPYCVSQLGSLLVCCVQTAWHKLVMTVCFPFVQLYSCFALGGWKVTVLSFYVLFKLLFVASVLAALIMISVLVLIPVCLYFVLGSSGSVIISIVGLFLCFLAVFLVSVLFNFTCCGSIGFQCDEFHKFLSAIFKNVSSTMNGLCSQTGLAVVPCVGVVANTVAIVDDMKETHYKKRTAFAPTSPTIALSIGISLITLTAFSFMATRGGATFYLIHTGKMDPQTLGFGSQNGETEAFHRKGDRSIPAQRGQLVNPYLETMRLGHKLENPDHYKINKPGDYKYSIMTPDGKIVTKNYYIFEERCCNDILECTPVHQKLEYDQTLIITRPLGYDPNSWFSAAFPVCYDIVCENRQDCNDMNVYILEEGAKAMSLALLGLDLFETHQLMIDTTARIADLTYGPKAWETLPGLVNYFFSVEYITTLFDSIIPVAPIQELLTAIMQIRFIAAIFAVLTNFFISGMSSDSGSYFMADM